ncbi:MAG TPA: hemerythrin domain-containing protein [Candidatus Kapabacteria bacterium]|nr:hemerythrin domain-containing protein [Candidatus Kapabacteria bacterium]
MKRHSVLIPFSHSHHEALLVALRLKKGGPSSANDTLWPKEPLEQAQALLRFADRELYPHFSLEEEYLFPAAAGKSEKIDTLISGLLSDHSGFRSALAAFNRPADSSSIAAQLKQFGEDLERHIRLEERELFPLIEIEVEKRNIILGSA